MIPATLTPTRRYFMACDRLDMAIAKGTSERRIVRMQYLVECRACATERRTGEVIAS